LGWLTTCWGAVVVVVEGPTGVGTGDVVDAGAVVEVAAGSFDVVVVVLVVVALAPATPLQASKGPHTRTAPARPTLRG
jgi:hypothetical protein